MKTFQKVKDHDNLLRDATSKAVINTDADKYAQYVNHKNQKKRISQIAEHQAGLKTDINNLKNEIQSLKELVLMSLENKG